MSVKYISQLILILMIGCAPSIKWTTTSTGLKYSVLKKGVGEPAIIGNEVLIHESLRYTNDSLLFDSHTLPQPIKIKIGANQAIAGVDEALNGMKKGEIRKLLVPPHLSRRSGNPTFPHPDSTLKYEIEIVQILH
jgi:FKBP-type peptidyl-prolyl cis-trans isomerase